MLQSAGTLSLKEILHIKGEGKTTKTHLPVMKGIINTKGSALYLTLMIGFHCDSTDPFGYHLQVNDIDRLPGTSNAYYATFHHWLAASKEYICLSKTAYHKAKLNPSSSY